LNLCARDDQEVVQAAAKVGLQMPKILVKLLTSWLRRNIALP